MEKNEFSRSFATDFAPQGRKCEWCGRLAVCYIIALGGVHHNQAAYLCASCEGMFLDTLRAADKPTLPTGCILLPASKQDIRPFGGAKVEGAKVLVSRM